MSDQPSSLLAELSHFGDSLIRNAPDAIVYADQAGVIRFWNRGAERIFGFAANEAIGQSLDIIIPETLRTRHWEGYDQVMRTGGAALGIVTLMVAGEREGRERRDEEAA